MIGVDTNVLLRAVLLDDPEQSERASKFLTARGSEVPAVINSVVLAEFVWTLRAACRLPRSEIVSILRAMVESEGFHFVDREAVLRALRDYEIGIGAFTDRLIAEINDAHGCSSTATFDAKAAKYAPFTAVP